MDPKQQAQARSRKIPALEHRLLQEEVKSECRTEILLPQTQTIRRKGNPGPQNLETVAKNACLHAFSINTMHRNIAPTVTRVPNIDHVQGPDSPIFHS